MRNPCLLGCAATVLTFPGAADRRSILGRPTENVKELLRPGGGS
jgi:hypothetical protein